MIKLLRILLPAILVCPVLFSEVVGFEVRERSAVLEGEAFGKAGGYERIVGKASFAVDPKAPANGIIHDLEFAARNKKGLVEFSADVYVLKPLDLAKGNGTVLLEVPNRGGKGLMRFNYGTRSLDPRTREEFGDGFLLKQGYTLVWVGWQFDLRDGKDVLRLSAPVAKGVSGLVRSEFSPSKIENSFSVAGPRHTPYPALDPADASYRLIVREYADGEGIEIPRDRWHFSDPTTVTMRKGFLPGKHYEVVYKSKDPAVAGLGAAAIRDLVSYLKFGAGEDAAVLGDAHSHIRHAIGYGSSQCGRFLRTFIYEGFNADEGGRKVFDGVSAHIAGAALGSFTHRFAQPTRTSPFYTIDVFPFRDLTGHDPVTSANDGILRLAEKAGVVPKIFYTNTSSEYWGRSASMMHTTIDGKDDAPLAPETRLYHFAGTQHGAGAVPPRKSDAHSYPANGNDYRPLQRALLVALRKWITEGEEPPASRYSSVAQLVPLGKLKFPPIPGFRTPGRVRTAMRLDYGPEFHSAGIISFEPPKMAGARYPVKLPQIDSDGNEIGGIRLPSIEAPLAAYTGWNLFNPKVIDTDEVAGSAGSTLYFARTKAERLKRKDPRPSIEERYESRDEYGRQARAAALKLVEERYLLEADLGRVVESCLALWDHLSTGVH